jgi:pyridoxamine 5'-phosphate oxidase
MNNLSLDGTLDMVWQHIGRGTADRHHPARHPTVATISEGRPEVRTLVQRAASRAEGTLEFHTDAASPKMDQIVQNPNVAIHFWIPKASLQIRIRAKARLLPGDPNLFEQLPEAAQLNYQGAAPGAPLPAESDETPNRFTRILCHLSEVDALVLSTPHQRAVYTARTEWSGHWVAP